MNFIAFYDDYSFYRLATAPGTLVLLLRTGGSQLPEQWLKVVQIIHLCPDDFDIFCGFDLIIYSTLAAGGAGAVPASGNIAPRLIVDLYNRFRAGKYAEARALQEKLAPLRKAFTLGTFPAVLKAGLELLGVPVGLPLLPVRPLTPPAREALKTTLKELDLIP